MRARTFTWAFTVIGAVFCFLHYFGYDPKNMMLFSMSVPLWFAPIFGDIHNISLVTAYVVTIASWMILGYIIDRIVQHNRERNRSSY